MAWFTRLPATRTRLQEHAQELDLHWECKDEEKHQGTWFFWFQVLRDFLIYVFSHFEDFIFLKKLVIDPASHCYVQVGLR